jgi:hypothetical protein
MTIIDQNNPEILDQNSPEIISLRDFFEKAPPSKRINVSTKKARNIGGKAIILQNISLPCGICKNEQIFVAKPEQIVFEYKKYTTEPCDVITYKCDNCEQYTKTYCVVVALTKDDAFATIFKVGEFPSFNPPAPSSLIRLLESEKDYFFKGKISEGHGLGIAALAYYRRIIEAKRNNIFDKIIQVSKALKAEPELIEELEVAKKESQFTSGIEKIKHALPPALLINGHNPLKLLYDALSVGVHRKSDDECLALATDIREVLTEFIMRLAQVMKDKVQLEISVSNLLQIKAKTEK